MDPLPLSITPKARKIKKTVKKCCAQLIFNYGLFNHQLDMVIKCFLLLTLLLVCLEQQSTTRDEIRREKSEKAETFFKFMLQRQQWNATCEMAFVVPLHIHNFFDIHSGACE
jgi:hypothetical protein